MKSNFYFEKESTHLIITVSGEYDFPDFVDYLKIIYAKCEEERNFRMLFNILGVEGIDVPTLERYFLGVEAAEKLKYKVKLAVVWHAEFTTYVAENVAVNRGAYIKVFGSVAPALFWLKNGQSDQP
jgi:hypothetical protein